MKMLDTISVSDPVYDSFKYSVRNSVEDSDRISISNLVWRSVYNSVYAPIEDSVWTSVHYFTKESTNENA